MSMHKYVCLYTIIVTNLYHSKDHQEIVTPWHSAFHHAEHPYGRSHSIQEPPRIGML